jgi:class 3 adenylate cyclase
MFRRELERFGGRIEDFRFDGVRAVFGAMRTREDDAERAVLAALDIIDRFDELSATQSFSDGRLSVGIATGRALIDVNAPAGTGAAIVAGDVESRAGSLQIIAPEGEILVDERTYRLTRDDVVYEEFASLTNVQERAWPWGVPFMALAWRVIGTRRRAGNSAAGVISPLVDRDYSP